MAVVLGATSALAVMSHTRSPEAFGAYAVSLRVLSLLQAPLLLGLGVTLPRVLPRLSERRDRSEELTSALCVISVVTSALLLVAISVGDLLAGWIFGPGFSGLILPLVLLIGTSLLHSTAYAFLRGSLRFSMGNVLTAVNLGVVPIVAAMTTSGVTMYLVFVSVCWAALSFAAIARELVVPHRLAGRMRALVRVGLGRVPGEFALFGLIAVPPLAVSATQSVAEAGRVSLAMSLLTLAGTSVAPFSAVLLPHVSQWLELGDGARLTATVRRALVIVVIVFVPATVLGELFAPTFLPMIFGAIGGDAVVPVRTLLLAAPAYATFVMLRSVIDGATAKATTMTLAVVAFAFFCTSWPLLRVAGLGPQTAILVACVASIWLMAGLLLASVRNLLRHLDQAVIA